MQYCSLRHLTLLSSPDTSTTEHCSCFDPAASFFLKLLVIAFCSSPVVYWTPSSLGVLIFWCHIFLLFHTAHGIFKTRILERVTISSSSGPHFLRTLHCLSWVALHSMVHSFIEIHDPFHYPKAVIMKWQKWVTVLKRSLDRNWWTGELCKGISGQSQDCSWIAYAYHKKQLLNLHISNTLS